MKATFEAIVASDIFLQLPSDTVLSLLEADDLQVNSEETVLKAIGRWVSPLGEVDETRLGHAETMMKEVRWYQIDRAMSLTRYDADTKTSQKLTDVRAGLDAAFVVIKGKYRLLSLLATILVLQLF
ncbi:unnamed protein product [Dibothriocephalus latus]|uniref:BACK domain-containing protein n=1 Tax=Dibothriocephalus latus TaxID=60516 RepID=A0A3P7PEL3_DIBLA|nr:unnamed protein product [Dibothriocephalus latus]